MKYRWFYFAISLLVIGPGLFTLLVFGLKPAIDFTGGSLLEVHVASDSAKFTSENVQKTVGDEFGLQTVQPTIADQFVLRGKPIDNATKNEILTKFQPEFGEVTEVRFETVGPVLGRELLVKTLFAGLLAMIVIILYIWHQFHNLKYGIAAVVAMLHDALVVVGSFAIMGKLWNVEVDVLFVTALLTILSFSVHDTIIVFDRIRENVRKHPRLPYQEVVNASILETLGRSINNSMTIIIMLLTLVLMGGESIHYFAVALLIGAVTGTYSSTFTAAPVLLLWDDIAAWFRQRRVKR